jgi:hypothetical protein
MSRSLLAARFQPRRPGSELLIRLAQNRRVGPVGHGCPEAGLLWAALAQPPEPVKLRQQAQSLRLPPPRNRPDQAHLPSVTVQVILAQEQHPPAGLAPIRWLLLTTAPVADAADVRRCLAYYSRRWLIERYHYVRKSGCRIEDSQLKAAERLERALATYSLVAWRLVWLTCQARQRPQAACTLAISTAQWQALYATIQQTRVLPVEPPSLGAAVRWIGQLGGFLGRRRDGEPGVKVLWRGWRRLEDLTAM